MSLRIETKLPQLTSCWSHLYPGYSCRSEPSLPYIEIIEN